MRQFYVENNDKEYQKLLKLNQTSGAPMDDKKLAGTPTGTRILTGKKTPDFGGTQSHYGFVMISAKVLGYVNLQARNLVGKSWLEIPD